MDALNNKISEIIGLNASYHIGAAYFLKKDKDGNKIKPEFDELWNLRLKLLLSEYLRGIPDADDDMKKLEDSFFLRETEKK
jgi:5-methylcytosine-specific restriction protein B